MATVVTQQLAGGRWPVGTLIDVYAFWDAARRPGGLVPVATGLSVAADGVLVPGLQPDTEYVAGTEVGGLWRGTKFRSQLTSAPDASELAAVWLDLPFDRAGEIRGGSGSTTNYLHRDAGAAQSLAQVDGRTPFYFDPAHYALGDKVTKLRLLLGAWINPAAPGVTFTLAMHPITLPLGGLAGASNTAKAVTKGASVGSAVIATPAASTAPVGVSAEFTAPAASWYVLGVTNTDPAATSNSMMSARVQMRRV